MGMETHNIVKNPSPYDPTYMGVGTHKVVKNPSLYKAYLRDYSDGDTTEKGHAYLITMYTQCQGDSENIHDGKTDCTYYSDGDTTERDMLISPPCVLSARGALSHPRW